MISRKILRKRNRNVKEKDILGKKKKIIEMLKEENFRKIIDKLMEREEFLVKQLASMLAVSHLCLRKDCIICYVTHASMLVIVCM